MLGLVIYVAYGCLLPLAASLNTVLNVEEINSIHYAVDILNKPVVKGQTLEGEVMTVVNKYGQEYRCSLPHVPPPINSDSKRDDDILDQLVDISVLLKPMETAPCLIKTVDWWTYEFCYGSVIKQYHLEDNKASGAIIILGKYESEYNWRNSSETKNRLQRFHSQFYVNGTKCDLTGEPRRTEIRFHCEDGVGDYMQRVDEPESCRYIVTVATTRVCHHPYLRLYPTATPHSITCAPTLTPTQHLKYLALHHKKLKEEEHQKNKWLEANAELMKEAEGESSKKQNILQPIPVPKEGRREDDDMKMNIKIFRLSPVKKQGGKGGEVQQTDVMEVETQITLEETDKTSEEEEDKPTSQDPNADTDTTADVNSGTTSDANTDTDTDVNDAGGETGEGSRVGPSGAKELLTNMDAGDLLRFLYLSQSQTPHEPGDSYLGEEDELEDDDDDNDEEELVRTGEGRQGSKSTRRDHFSKIQKRLKHLGNMFTNQQEEDGAVEGDKQGVDGDGGDGDELDKFIELQKVVDRIEEGQIKELNHDFEKWTKKFLSKDDVLDETEEEDSESMEQIIPSLLAALQKAEKKLTSAKQEMEIVKEIMEEIRVEGGEAEEEEDPIEGTTQSPSPLPQDSEGSSKDSKKDSEKEASRQLRIIKGSKGEDDSQQTKLAQTIKDSLQKLGLEKIGRKIEVKIMTGTSLEDEDTGSPLLSQEETHAFQNMIVNLLSANAEELEERENHRKLEKNYAFKWDDEQLAREEQEEQEREVQGRQ